MVFSVVKAAILWTDSFQWALPLGRLTLYLMEPFNGAMKPLCFTSDAARTLVSYIFSTLHVVELYEICQRGLLSEPWTNNNERRFAKHYDLQLSRECEARSRNASAKYCKEYLRKLIVTCKVLDESWFYIPVKLKAHREMVWIPSIIFDGTWLMKWSCSFIHKCHAEEKVSEVYLIFWM